MKERIKILSTVSIVHAINDGSIAAISILFPIFKNLFGLTYTQVGIITGGGLFITLVMQLVFGRLADGKNVNNFLLLGVLLISISLFLLPLSRSFLTLLFFMFLLRFATSFFHPIGVGWISRTFKKERLDWAMGIQSGSADVGSFIAVATTLFLSELWFWTFPIYLWAIIAIGCLLVGFSLTYTLDTRWMIVTKPSQKQSLKTAIADAFSCMKRIKILLPAFMISGAAWGVIITFLPLLLSARTTLSLPLIGLLVAAWIGFGSLASFSYGHISTYIRRKRILLFSYSTIGVMSFLLILTTQPILLLFILIILGLAIFLTYPALFSFVSEVTAESVEGWTFGITFTFQTGGGTIILFLSGVLSDRFGIWIPFATLGLLALAFACSLLVVYKKSFAHQ